jgi:hypothetical protein
MARKPIDVGTIGNDGTGDSIRDAFRKVNDNFRELYSSLGLGDRLRFEGLDDTPDSYVGQENAVVTVNSTTDGLAFRKMEAGDGIQLDFTTNANAIRITNLFSDISGDPRPILGGPLNAQFGVNRSPIGNLVDLNSPAELTAALAGMRNAHTEQAANPDRLAANKSYVDDKIARSGVDSIDPATGATDTSWGQMTGPLILSRDPIADDDIIWNGQIAATKRYVDNAGFGSVANLYVATSGLDDRQNVSDRLLGRSLATAYRTIEAALKKAEDLVLETPISIGPYKKVLTYNNGQSICTLKAIGEVAGAGSGFSGQLFMSVNTVEINNGGGLYLPGEIIQLVGGTSSQAARIEILSVNVTPNTGGRGSVQSLRIITSGVYTSLPGNTAVGTTPTSFGAGLTLNVTYNVNNIEVLEGGSGYGLVSVRIIGGGGSGAFGRADVVGGEIVGITVTDKGTGFTTLPNVIVNLPRFFIETESFRTDFTGNVISEGEAATRTRDLREGLLLRGETSGALALILAHTGALSSESDTLGSEIFDVDLIAGEFQLGEAIAYGDVTKNVQIAVFVESGIYEENYPLRVPQNVAVIGDEFRRTIIKPKTAVSGAPLSGVSSSPWASLYFRRDPSFDGMTITNSTFGHHYLSDSTEPIYPLIENRGDRLAAAQLLRLNREFIKSQVIGWINNQIVEEEAPFNLEFVYNQDLCRRDIGLIIDALVFDLKYGGYSRTISAALKYFASVSSLKAVTDQLEETVAGIERINELAQDIILNILVTDLYTVNGTAIDLLDPEEINSVNINQVLDQAFVAESGSGELITNLINAIVDIISESDDINYPKNNDQIDVFLCNDANIIRAVTCQGHSGFMMVLDPEGQILTKSPYCQESACFSKSTGRKTFAGGMFVDGFTGNQQFRIVEAAEYAPGFSNTLTVDGLLRPPQTPCSFIVNDIIYRVNYIRNYNYAIDYPTAESDGTSQWYSSVQLILDETTPWTFGVFEYSQDICYRDVGLIIDGLGYDIAFQTNYHQRKSGLSYRLSAAQNVLDDQLDITLDGIAFAHNKAAEFVGTAEDSSAEYVVDITTSNETIATIIEFGEAAAPTLVLTNPPGVASTVANAKNILLANVAFIKAETIGWINDQILNETAPFTSGFTYDSVRYARDVGYIVEAVAYDLLYGGNSQTRDVALKYYDGVGDLIEWQLPAGTEAETAAAVEYVKYLCGQVILNSDPADFYSAVPRVTGSAGSMSEVTISDLRIDAIIEVITDGVAEAPALTLPNLSAYAYDAFRVSARNILVTDKETIQDATIFHINLVANQYEILMPGNRSMLSNDFTQVNDLGYGLVVANGGLTEAVSMFTYYCQISYYALTGGQIRSIGGSSAHGNYALVSEGSDPLEVPTPVSLYHRLSQGATVFASTIPTRNVQGSVVIFINFDDYQPLPGSELEVNHNNLITRYAVSGVDLFDRETKFARITISSAGGLQAGIPHGQRVVIRQNSFVVLTGDVVDVATRPSTALILEDSPDVYRVLDFNEYNELSSADVFNIVNIDTASGVITTDVPHRQQVGFQITIRKLSTDILPAVIVASTPAIEGPPLIPAVIGVAYFVHSVISPTEFTISLSKLSASLDMTAGPEYGGTETATVEPFGLALTQLIQNYNYTISNIFPAQPFKTPGSLINCTVTAASPAVVTSNTHGLVPGDQIRFDVSGSGTIPEGIGSNENYWVVTQDLSTNTFKIADIPPIDSTQVGINGVLTGTTITGLVSTIQLAIGMRLVPVPPINILSIVGDGSVATVTYSQKKKPPYLPGQVVIISDALDVGFDNISAIVLSCSTTELTYSNTTVASVGAGGDISVTQTGNLGATPTIASITNSTTIVISTSVGITDGSVVFGLEGTEVNTTTTGNNVQYGKLIGDQNETTVAIIDLPNLGEARILNSLFSYQGTDYRIVNYQERPTGETYSLITLDKPLEISLIAYPSPIAIKSGVDVTTSGARGTLTIRIALVRVTSHDFLEIGTGGYADTNYPNDIFGPAVNDFNTVPLYATDVDPDGRAVTRAQVQERNVGRAFFVTTDQYGNFSVGPYFKVDQGTGTVTFSASIALSQLDGLGFKRGATIAEFSVDDSMADAANDAVPTEGAVRNYIDRRLGVSHFGVNVLSDNTIPSLSGGFMALTGQLAMKGVMSLGTFKIENLGEPVLGSDAARLDSIKFSNLKDDDGSVLLNFTDNQAGQLLALTGADNEIKNFTVVGDVVLGIVSGQISTAISNGVIINSDVNASAAIEQSKLAMNAATTRANATDIVQADRGLISLNSAEFTVTNGWTELRTNGIAVGKLAQVATDTVLGRSAAGDGNVSAVAFTTVVDEGFAVKKSQFGQSGSVTGFLRRNAAGNDDANFTTVEATAAKTGNTLASRDVNGDFAGRQITADQLRLTTTSTGNYTVLRSNEITTVNGSTEIFGYGGGGGSSFVGIGIEAGSAGANNRTFYNNTTHTFRNQAGSTTFATLDNTGFNIGARALTATTLTTGAAGTAGIITGTWTLSSGSTFHATYAADLAEYYEGDAEYEVGTVLVFGGEKEVTLSTDAVDSRVAGVVSDRAAYSMNGACPGYKNQIALQGRVPVKVVGKISKGTILVTSDIPGVATAAGNDVKAGTMIGKALENYDSDRVGTIEVAVGRT